MLEGYHYQNAYLTRDIEKWVDVFHQRAKVDKLIRYEGATSVQTPAGPVIQTSKLAFIWVGDLQYELIEPISYDVPMYRDMLPADDSLQFHHTCMRVADWDDFRARVDQQSYPIAVEGGNEALRYLFLDAREFLGHFLEYTWMTDERWGQLGGRARAWSV